MTLPTKLFYHWNFHKLRYNHNLYRFGLTREPVFTKPLPPSVHTTYLLNTRTHNYYTCICAHTQNTHTQCTHIPSSSPKLRHYCYEKKMGKSLHKALVNLFQPWCCKPIFHITTSSTSQVMSYYHLFTYVKCCNHYCFILSVHN